MCFVFAGVLLPLSFFPTITFYYVKKGILWTQITELSNIPYHMPASMRHVWNTFSFNPHNDPNAGVVLLEKEKEIDRKMN